VLRLVIDYDALEAAKVEPLHAVAALQAQRRRYDPTLLDALARAKARVASLRCFELGLDEVQQGMFLANDILSTSGVVLVPRGHEVTPGLLQRLRSFAAGTVREPIAVRVPTGPNQPARE
jgi:hypothetical protein